MTRKKKTSYLHRGRVTLYSTMDALEVGYYSISIKTRNAGYCIIAIH